MADISSVCGLSAPRFDAYDLHHGEYDLDGLQLLPGDDLPLCTVPAVGSQIH